MPRLLRRLRSKRTDKPEYELGIFSGAELLKAPNGPPDETQLDPIFAQEATEALRQGGHLEKKRVTGDLILGQDGLGHVVETEREDGLKVTAGGFGPPTFDLLAFPSKIEIRSCILEGRFILSGLSFAEAITVAGSDLRGPIDFQHSDFRAPVSFYGCRFDGRVGFADTTFQASGVFDESTFQQGADFYNAQFQSHASFRNAIFRGRCNFTHCHFHRSALGLYSLGFDHVLCYEDALFTEAGFDGIADFSATDFRRRAGFHGARFRHVSFVNCDFNRLDLKWEQVAGERLLFGPIITTAYEPDKTRLVPEDLRGHFAHRVEAPLSEKHRQFDRLKGIFQRQGDYVSADDCFYEWKQVERRQSPLGWNPENWIAKAFYHLNWITCGYGVRPVRTVFFASIVILLFSLLYTAIGAATGTGAGVLNSLETSFLVFMNFAPGGAEMGSIGSALALAERVLGWFTLLLFVTTYTRILLR